MFTARYALSPYIKQIRFVFKGLKKTFSEENHIGWGYVLNQTMWAF
jgi:hypothetical protein